MDQGNTTSYSSQELILQLLLEDVVDIGKTQKSKRQTSSRTDLLLTLSCVKDHILTVRTSLEDETMALSISTAIATDQALLACIQYDEVTGKDHRPDPALDNGESASNRRRSSNAPNTAKRSLADERNDIVSIVLGDLMDRAARDNKPEEGEGSTRQFTSQTADSMKKCGSCLESCEKTFLMGSCGHHFCRNCTKQMFIGAIKDEEMYPPRCCGNVVSPAVALRVLDYDELRSFSKKAIEWIARDRLYCADLKCSQFIPPSAIVDEIGTCPTCHQQTHFTCRSFVHPKVDCPKDHALQQVLQMAEAKSWKRCSKCRSMVELLFGCNHITCRCGHEFCYNCGRTWRRCDCPNWDEDQLIARGN